MSHSLDPKPPVDDEGFDTGEGGSHFEPVRVTVDIIIDRDAFHAHEDARASALKVLEDAIEALNATTGMTHRVLPVKGHRPYRPALY